MGFFSPSLLPWRDNVIVNYNQYLISNMVPRLPIFFYSLKRVLIKVGRLMCTFESWEEEGLNGVK